MRTFLAALSALAPLFGPAAHEDPVDAAAGAVDLRRAAFGQVETHLVLRLRAEAPWASADGPCLTLRGGTRAERLCVDADGRGAPQLRLGDRRIRAVVTRPTERTLVARLPPRVLGLPDGRLRWFATTAGDRLPDTGSARARIGVYGAPDCFGAAAVRCRNPALARLAVPAPRDALLMHDGPCAPYARPFGGTLVDPCEVGDRFAQRTARVALVGDSHARHLRAAVHVAAYARGWRAVVLVRSGCPFSTATYPGAPSLAAPCRRHSEETLRWLRTHPRIHTVVTSSATGRGMSAAGYAAMWSRVPSTVRRIVVVRDVPRAGGRTGDCVEAVLRRRGTTRGACSMARSQALLPDAQAEAAAAAGGRVRVVDLTRQFCDTARCYPVIGGVYVYRDADHLNRVFSATLGPYLLGSSRAARSQSAISQPSRSAKSRSTAVPRTLPRTRTRSGPP